MRNYLFLTFLALFIIVSGCSTDKYNNLISKADQAMENMDFDKAIDIYEEILDLDSNSMKYAEGRKIIVRQLLNRATKVQTKIDDFQSQYEKLLNELNNINFDEDEISHLIIMYKDITSLFTSLEEYPSIPMYNEVLQLQKKYVEDLKNNRIEALTDTIEQSIAIYAFDNAEKQLNSLNEIASLIADYELDESISNFSNQIESLKGQYIEYPVQAKKYDKVLHEDRNGKIILYGEGIKGKERSLFIKYEGALRFTAPKIGLNSKIIFEDGSSINNSSPYFRYYKDFVFGIIPIRTVDKKINRFDFSFDFEGNDELRRIDIEANEKEVIVPGIESLPNKIPLQIVHEDKDFTLELKELLIENKYSITVKGIVTAKKDIELDERNILFIPLYQDYFFNLPYKSKKEFFEGIPTEFSYTFNTESWSNKDILFGKEVDYIKLYLFNDTTAIFIDLVNHNEYQGPTDRLRNNIFAFDGQLLFDYNNGDFFKDVNGNLLVDAFAIKGEKSLFNTINNPTAGTILAGKFQKLSLDIALDNSTSSIENGHSKVFIIGDGQVLQELEIDSNFKTKSIEIDVKGIDILEFKVQQNFGNDKPQLIILSNGVLYY